jgi:hypothetical protein
MAYNTVPPVGQQNKAASLPVVIASDDDVQGKLGALAETAPTTDTASSGLNGRLQRIAQRITSLIALIPTSLGQKTKAGSLAVTLASDQDALPITDNGGNLSIDDGGNSITVDGSVAVTQPTGTNLHTVIDSGVVTSITNVVHVDDNSSTLSIDDGGGSITVDGTFWQATQPISGTVTVANPTTNPETGLAKDGTDISSPTAMPTGGVGLRGWISAIWTKLNGTIAVSGTFWQATQPVSGSVSVSNFPGTQPVSGTVTANAGTNLNTSALALDATLTGGTQKAIARGGGKGSTTAGDITGEAVDANTQALHTFVKNASLAVTGTFWQATQPVSGPLTDTQLRASAVPVSLAANQSVNNAQVGGTNVSTGNGVVGAGVQRVAIASDNTAFPVNATLNAETTKVIGTVNVAAGQSIAVTQQAITKGTQGSTGVTTQDLKDAGRSAILAYAQAIAGAASETIISTFAVSKAFGAPSAATVTSLPNTTVTSGKTFRIQSIIVSFVSTTTTANSTKIGIRVNTGGAGAIGSSLVFVFPRIAWPSATFIANEAQTVVLQIPDGLEIPAGAGIAITHTEAAANGTIDVSVIGYEY